MLETETDTERRENVLAARFRDTERESAGVGLMAQQGPKPRLGHDPSVGSHKFCDADCRKRDSVRDPSLVSLLAHASLGMTVGKH